ncbi:Bug family tripartite tricarboxylate transporter substrate binding protein [Candidimonas nitroreducens]|uniref:LacI family transcriptional regulator n=1 Tax=Candidimonas nitroreducens TaxID=683354 RepID=A0A225MZA7_9BURK|nr:tripartite tricarboxylate transporter substrate binding protein [Candidimonas nitroreducens]OWT64019.1 hypothetical protein CEY11_06910 [Candidimonas nitroreducens]
MNWKPRITSLIASALAIGTTLAFTAAPASAAYPDKPIRFIVPFTPAGATDVVARIVAENIAQKTKATFVIENRPGAGGNIGMSTMVHSPADGYTIGMIVTSHAINMSMPEKPNYDVTKDLTAVSMLCKASNVLLVNPKLPVHSVAELIKLGQSGKTALNFGSAGNGTSPHVAGELFKQMTHVKMTHVPYRGAGPAMIDLISGNIQLMFSSIANSVPHIKHGDVRALAVTSTERSPLLPDVPTFAEAGLPGYVVEGWLGIVAPAGIPADALSWLRQHISVALKDPGVIKAIDAQGLQASSLPPEKFQAYIDSEVEKWRRVPKTDN